ncbi:MAG: phage protease, partial [Geminicoccales bacterium]
DRAVADSKLPPFLKEWAISLCSVNKPAFDGFLKRTGSISGAIIPGGDRPPGYGTARAGLTADELAVCNNLGISPEDFAKTNKG